MIFKHTFKKHKDTSFKVQSLATPWDNAMGSCIVYTVFLLLGYIFLLITLSLKTVIVKSKDRCHSKIEQRWIWDKFEWTVWSGLTMVFICLVDFGLQGKNAKSISFMESQAFCAFHKWIGGRQMTQFGKMNGIPLLNKHYGNGEIFREQNLFKYCCDVSLAGNMF